jgi:hypothetical protein
MQDWLKPKPKYFILMVKKGKAIPVIGCEGP